MSAMLIERAPVPERSRPAVPRSITFAFALLITLFSMLVSGFAPATAAETNTALQSLSETVASNISGNQYEVSGGSYIQGSQLLVKDANTGVYQINDAEFNKLNSKGKDALATDIVNASRDTVANGEDAGITEETQSNWFRELQQNPGFGSKILGETLKQTGPDFVTANRIYQPIAPFVSALLGIFAILIFALLGLVIACDLFYITIPPFRLIAGESEGGAGAVASKLISHEALSAVKEAETDSSDGKTKSALGIYLKKRIIAMFVLALCLVYLIQGQIYVAIGWFLDMLNGFLGF